MTQGQHSCKYVSLRTRHSRFMGVMRLVCDSYMLAVRAVAHQYMIKLNFSLIHRYRKNIELNQLPANRHRHFNIAISKLATGRILSKCYRLLKIPLPKMCQCALPTALFVLANGSFPTGFHTNVPQQILVSPRPPPTSTFHFQQKPYTQPGQTSSQVRKNLKWQPIHPVKYNYYTGNFVFK